MRYVAAYLLAVLGDKTSPSQNDIEKILSSVGIEADTERLKKVISELKDKSIDEVISKGKELLSTVLVGGAAPAAAVAAPGAAAAPVEEKKEEKKPAKEESESEDEDMGFGLFD